MTRDADTIRPMPGACGHAEGKKTVWNFVRRRAPAGAQQLAHDDAIVGVVTQWGEVDGGGALVEGEEVPFALLPLVREVGVGARLEQFF